MNLGPMAEALAPLQARMPKIVPEREILRVVATVRGNDPGTAISLARREVLNWAQRRSGGKLPRKAWEGQRFEHRFGDQAMLGVRVNDEEMALWALRCDDPDKNFARRIWKTEVTLGQRGGSLPQISLRSLVATPEENLLVNPDVPDLLQQISEKCGLDFGAFPLSAQALRIDSDADANELVEMLESRGRRLPVLVASGDERAGDLSAPLIDVDALARGTLGLAHVAALPAKYTYALSDAFGKIRSVDHGAVRVYWPGFDSASNPHEHMLILKDDFGGDHERAAIELQRSVAAESLRRTRLGHDVITFAAVRSADLRAEQEQRSREGASEADRIETLENRIKALETELDATKADARQNFELAASEEERAKQAEAQLNSARSRIQSLEARLKPHGMRPDDNLMIPNSWGGFADWCEENFAGRCVLASAARRGVRRPEFKNVALVGRCLHWLASTCLDHRIKGGGSLKNVPIEDGVENAPCGADTFDFEFQGRRLQANWHVKSGGNTRDPSRCLRIYYAFDARTQQIVIAEMPAHRRTEAS